jgi:spectinomycin phosphotransferase
VAPELLLTLTPYLDAVAGPGPLVDDAGRERVASLLGALHRQSRPRYLPVWRPLIGWHAHAGREELERCLATRAWSDGPWSGPAERLLDDAAPVLTLAIRRFQLLGAAVAGHADRWVVTHGEPHTANVLGTPDGLRLVDWATARLAPRERDLRQALGEADGGGPWLAYLEAGGRPDPLSQDALEMFALEWHLSEIAEYAVRFSRAHEDTPDDRRCFARLEAEVAALLAGWS